MKVLGVALLAFLVLYKDLNGKPFHQGWWGILGLIGWTYVVCAGIYLFTRESLRKNVIAWLVVMLLAVISHSSLIPQEYGLRVILLPFIPSDWTLHAFGMSGVLTSLLMQKYADRNIRVSSSRFFVYWVLSCLLLHSARILTGLFQDTGYPELVVLLPGCILPAVRLVLLADGCERQNALVRYYQTCRNSYTDMLYPSLRMVCCAAIAGFALSRAIECRCSGLIKIAYILPHHCPIDRTVGEG